MRFASTTIAASALLATVTLSDTCNALDLFTGDSPWDVLATAPDSGNGKPTEVNPTQIFVQCLECAALPATLALGEDTLTMPVPYYDGTVSRFTLQRTTDAVIAKELQSQFLDAQTYFGRNSQGVSVELDITMGGGVRVQFHSATGELSYLDKVDPSDRDLKFASQEVRDAVNQGIPVFRVYRRIAGQRASDPQAAPAPSSQSAVATNMFHAQRPSVARRGRRLQNETCTGEPSWMADEHCDPINNNAGCSWDGGACCGRNVDKKFCTVEKGGGPDSEACSCLDPSSDYFVDANNCTTGLVGNGVCDANNNNAVCGYDGGDCCGVFVDKTECKDGDNCECAPEYEFNSFNGQIYRIAIGTSTGYSAIHGNSVESVLSEVLTAVNRVSGIYKRSLNIGLQLIGNTTKLFEFESDAETEFDKAGAVQVATETFASKLGGVDEFDIGHILLSSDTSSIDGQVCGLNKANAGSGLASPNMDSFYIDVLAQGIARQFAAGYTSSGRDGQCTSDRFESRSAVEPGSGSTIMSFGGKCRSDDNIQDSNDPYFALISLEEIRRFTLNIFNDTTCGLSAPAVVVPKLAPGLGFSQGQCQVPRGTGFVLAPKVNDIVVSPNQGANFSYSWEQADLAATRNSLGAREFGPIFRSRMPIDEPVRYFPGLATSFAGASQRGEPQRSWPVRDFRFSLTVRDMWQFGPGLLDNQTDLDHGRGSYAAEQVAVSVKDVEPFTIDAQASADNTTVTVTWTQVSSSVLPANGASSNARVSLSYDNGVTFSTPVDKAFTESEAVVVVKACADDASQRDNVVALVEVESVAGCGFYAVHRLGSVTCPEIALPTTAPTHPTSSPGMSPTFEPTYSPTFAPTQVPTYTPTTSPTGPTVAPGIDSGMLVAIVALSAGGLIVVGATAGVLMTRKNATDSTPDSDMGSDRPGGTPYRRSLTLSQQV